MNGVKSAASAKRPRIWVPGVLFVSDEQELLVGDHVGFNGRGKAFAVSRCGHAGSVREWRHRAWLVRRDDLDEAIVEEHAIILPETLLDPDVQPHARKWLASQPLVCVSGAKVTRLLGAGLRIYTVEHGADVDGLFAVSAEGGERAGWSLSIPFDELCPDSIRPEGDAVSRLWRSERLELRTFIDRVLDEISRGVLREAAVVNALAARILIEPGYGYRGATFGTAAPVEEVGQALRGLDSLFEQVFRRAKSQRGEAREIARAVETVPADAKSLDEIPVYGSARRVTLDELVIPIREGTYLRAGDEQAVLVLPEQARWFVDRVASWTPKLTPELEEELEEQAVSVAAPPAWVTLTLSGVLLAIIIIGYLMTAG